MKKQTYQQKRDRTGYGMLQAIVSLCLFLLLVSCGSTASRNGTSTPSPNPTPSATQCLTPTPNPTQAPMQEPTQPPAPTQEPTQPSPPTQVPTPKPTTPPAPSPCTTGSGVQPVSSVEVDYGNRNRPRIAFTFDAGGPVEPAPLILDSLASHNLHVTFFLTGVWAQQNPDLVRRISNAGHEIGNHTVDHPDLTTLPDNAVCNELVQADQTISAITGHTTRPYFRPPYGARNDHVRQLAANLGYHTIYWTIDTLDWKTDATPDQIISRVMGNLSNGAIILMHAGSSAEAKTLDRLIPMIQQKGYEIVNLTQVLQ